MREVIALNIGQAGVQMGAVCWQLYCVEHGLDENGSIVKGTMPGSDGDHGTRISQSLRDGCNSLFSELENGNYTPKTVFVDLDPSVIDQIIRGPYRRLYSAHNFVSGKEDAANNYARGYYSLGLELIDLVSEAIRKVSESCDGLLAFLMYHSYGGGTGSGFHTRLLEKLHDEWGRKKSKLEIAIFPSMKLSTSVVEPYNAVLATNATLDLSDCVFLADNEAMYNICHARLDIDNPSYVHLNRLLAQTVSSITASLRFKGTLNADFVDFPTNLVPFPRIHFPVISYAPIIRRDVTYQSVSVADITRQCFDNRNSLVKYNANAGKYVSIFLLYRGDVAAKEINAAIASIKEKRQLKFVDWSPTGFKLGINNSAPSVLPNDDCIATHKAACMLCNTTAIKALWANINNKYGKMVRKKAFFHWFTKEGLNENEFFEAEDNVLTLEEEFIALEELQG